MNEPELGLVVAVVVVIAIVSVVVPAVLVVPLVTVGYRWGGGLPGPLYAASSGVSI